MESIGADLRQMQRTPLAASHVQALRDAGKMVTHPVGAILARSGEPITSFVYVEEGEVEAINPDTNERHLPFTLGPAQFATLCNCSICTKSRFWFTLVQADDFKIEKGEDQLFDYTWIPPGKSEANLHYRFCETCGVRVFGQGDNASAGGKFYAVAARCPGPIHCLDNCCHGNYTSPVNSPAVKKVYNLKIRRPTQEFVPLIMQVRMAIIQSLDQEFLSDADVASLEVTSAQFAILKNVLKGKSSAACELCKAMDYDRGAMSRMIDRLEKKGLIRRVALAHTRRTRALEVTAEGKAAFPKMQACLSRVVIRMLKGVTSTQVHEVERILRRMLANT